MQLKPTDKPWCPVDKPDYLTVYQGEPPQDPETLQALMVEMLQRLRAEADPEAIREANRRLEANLTADSLDFLPGNLMENPRAPELLLTNRGLPETKLEEWREGLSQALQLPQMSQAEALELLGQESLESFLSRVV